MLPSRDAPIPPLAEHARDLERQAAALQERDEAARKPGPVEVDEVPAAPVRLKIRRVREPELERLAGTVGVPAAVDFGDEADVGDILAEEGGEERGGDGVRGVGGRGGFLLRVGVVGGKEDGVMGG